MTRGRKYIAVYKRLETDVEFRRRVITEKKLRNVEARNGKELDYWAWENHKMQRKILEDVSEAG